MQLHDVLTIPKIFIGLDIHKKSWTASIQTDLFFHKTYSIPSNADKFLSSATQKARLCLIFIA